MKYGELIQFDPIESSFSCAMLIKQVLPIIWLTPM